MSTKVEDWTPQERVAVGARLKRTRQQQGLSVRQLAAAANLSKTSVVNLESGTGFRTSTCLKVANVLGIHLDNLLTYASGTEIPYAVHKIGDDKWYDLARFGDGPLAEEAQSDGTKRRSLSQIEGVTPLNILRSRFDEGLIKPTVLELFGPSETRSHVGEEFVYVLAGRAIVTVGDSEIFLEAGESIIFWSAEAHSYRPDPESSSGACLLSVRVDS